MSERELFDKALERAIEMTSELVMKNREQLWRARKTLGSRIKASVGISLGCYGNAVDVSVSLNFIKDRVKDEAGARFSTQPELPLQEGESVTISVGEQSVHLGPDAADRIEEVLDEIEAADVHEALSDEI